MIKYNSLDRIKYNSLSLVRYNSRTMLQLERIVTRVGDRPVLLDPNMRQIAVLENSFDVFLDQQVGGIDEVTLSLPMDDRKRQLIANESYIQMFDTIYVVREVSDYKSKRVSEVFAEALWYDLQYAEVLDKTEWDSSQAGSVMIDILKGTGWALGRVDIESRRTLRTDISKNRLEVLGEIESLYNGELIFDTQAMTVGLVKPEGKHTGASISYDKNASDIEAHYDTRDLVTKIYAYGKNGMSIADANEGVPYLEDYSYTNRVRVRTIKDERYTNPFHLRDVVRNALDVLAKPTTSYSVKMAELSKRSGLEHEQFFIGGIVRIYDKELNLDVDARIMDWKYNVIDPNKTELTLENTAKTLSDLLTGVDNFGGMLEQGDAVERADLLDLSVFNYLLNSRADDGMAYWQSTGWSIDANSGSSGGASFRTTGELGKTKEISQTVYPSNHDAYAISFQAQANSVEVAEGGRVGVEVTVVYEDGTEENSFIPLTQ